MSATQEMETPVKVRQKGQVTIPLNIRESLGIKEDDMVKIKVSKLETAKGG